MARYFTALTLLVCLAAVLPAGAQSLGDVARKEAARRKAIGTPAKVHTNETLGVGAVPPSPAGATGAPAGTSSQPALTGASPAAPSAAVAQGAPAPQAVPAGESAKPARGSLTEAEWRTRVADAREALTRAEVLRDALQSRVNALATDFINRDDPAQRDAIQAERQRALAELDRAGREIKARQKATADIQEEARRAGVPPGWLR